jgi:hypothetical protein
MTEWLIAGVIIVVLVFLVVRMSRSTGPPAWHDTARSEQFSRVMAERGLEARPAAKPTATLPEFRLPLGWGWRSPAAAEAAADGTRWVIYDSEQRGRSVVGCNSTGDSSGENIVARHTVVAAASDRLALPRFTLTPNLVRMVEQAIPARLQEAGLADSKIAGVALKAGMALTRLQEHGTAIGFPGAPAFVDAFRVTADDEAAVRALFDQEAIALLRQRPWAIVEGQGEWLAVSRNTGEVLRTREEHGSDGWLSMESVAEVAALASELATRWRGRNRA